MASSRRRLKRCCRIPTTSRCMRRTPKVARKMLTEKHFRMMKPSAIFINTGRGPTVDEAALIKALQAGLDRGRRPRRAGDRAAEARQSAAEDGQRHPHRACRLGVGAVRSGAPPPRRAGDRACLAGLLAARRGQSRRAGKVPTCAAGSLIRWNAALRPDLGYVATFEACPSSPLRSARAAFVLRVHDLQVFICVADQAWKACRARCPVIDRRHRS